MRIPVAIVSAAALLVLGPVAAASAAPPPSGPTTLAEGLVSPLHVSGGPGKDVTVSQEFQSQLTTFDKWSSATVYEAPGWDVAGSDYRGSTLYFLESQGAGPEDPRPLAGSLKSIHGRGTVSNSPSLGPAASLSLDWETFVRLACGRVHPDAVSDRIKSEGDPELVAAILRNLAVTP